MTAADFRRLALALPEAVEAEHMGHPDFRVRRKIFATLGYPDRRWGVVALTPKQQQRLVDMSAGVFVPAAGAWGRSGMTSVLLGEAAQRVVSRAIFEAWCNVAPKTLVRSAYPPPPRKRR